MDDSHRLIGTFSNRLLLIPAANLEEEAKGLPVRSEVLFSYRNEYLQGRIVFRGDRESCLLTCKTILSEDKVFNLAQWSLKTSSLPLRAWSRSTDSVVGGKCKTPEDVHTDNSAIRRARSMSDLHQVRVLSPAANEMWGSSGQSVTSGDCENVTKCKQDTSTENDKSQPITQSLGNTQSSQDSGFWSPVAKILDTHSPSDTSKNVESRATDQPASYDAILTVSDTRSKGSCQTSGGDSAETVLKYSNAQERCEEGAIPPVTPAEQDSAIATQSSQDALHEDVWDEDVQLHYDEDSNLSGTVDQGDATPPLDTWDDKSPNGSEDVAGNTPNNNEVEVLFEDHIGAPLHVTLAPAQTPAPTMDKRKRSNRKSDISDSINGVAAPANEEEEWQQFMAKHPTAIDLSKSGLTWADIVGMDSHEELPGEVNDCYHTKDPGISNSQWTAEHTPTKSPKQSLPGSSARKHNKASKNPLFVILKVACMDLEGVDPRIDIPKVLIFAQEENMQHRSLPDTLNYLKDKSDERMKAKFDIYTCSPTGKQIAPFLQELVRCPMLDRVDNIDMQSLSLAKCHKMSFDHTGATVIGMEKAVDDTFATENTIMAMLQRQKVKVKFEHRSEAASPGSRRNPHLSREHQLSPTKMARSPKKASMLKLKDRRRLPSVCPWCLKWMAKLHPHMVSKHHRTHIFYKKLLEMKKISEEKYRAYCCKLSQVGRHRNNILAVTKKDRNVIPSRRSDNVPEPTTHIWCTLCNRLVSRRAFRESHLEVCARNKEVQLSTEAKDVLVRHCEPVLECEDVAVARLLAGKGDDMFAVLYPLKSDRLAITQFVTQDRIAAAMLNNKASDGAGKENWIQATRLRLRLLFGIYKFFRSAFPEQVHCFMDIMRYSTWHFTPEGSHRTALISSVESVCGFEAAEKTFVRYNDVMTSSSVLQSATEIALFDIHHEDAATLRLWTIEGKLLMQYLKSDSWKVYTVRRAAHQKSRLHNFRKYMVPPGDFQFYLNLTEDKVRLSYQDLVDAWASGDKAAARKAHTCLVEALPTAIGTFTYRRVSEAFVITRSEFRNRPNLVQLLLEHKHLVTAGAAEEIGKVMVIESRGKGDNAVVSVVKIEWLPMMELLDKADLRTFVGLPDRNKYLFGSVSSREGLGHANPSNCQRKFSQECAGKVEDHTKLRSRHFRLTFATTLGGMDLTYSSKELLFKMMGHSEAVHERHYNVPQPLQMAALMGFACRASADNSVQSLQAKTIESQVNLPVEQVADEDLHPLPYSHIYDQVMMDTVNDHILDEEETGAAAVVGDAENPTLKGTRKPKNPQLPFDVNSALAKKDKRQKRSQSDTTGPSKSVSSSELKIQQILEKTTKPKALKSGAATKRSKEQAPVVALANPAKRPRRATSQAKPNYHEIEEESDLPAREPTMGPIDAQSGPPNHTQKQLPTPRIAATRSARRAVASAAGSSTQKCVDAIEPGLLKEPEPKKKRGPGRPRKS